MTRADLGLPAAHVLISFATAAGPGALLLYGSYCLDVGAMRTMLAVSGSGIHDIGLVPFACAFGALATGTSQATGSSHRN